MYSNGFFFMQTLYLPSLTYITDLTLSNVWTSASSLLSFGSKGFFSPACCLGFLYGKAVVEAGLHRNNFFVCVYSINAYKLHLHSIWSILICQIPHCRVSACEHAKFSQILEDVAWRSRQPSQFNFPFYEFRVILIAITHMGLGFLQSFICSS